MNKIIILFLIMFSLFSCTDEKESNNGKKISLESKNEIMEKQNIGSLIVSEFKEKIGQDYILIDIRTRPEIFEGKIDGMDISLDFYHENYMKELESLDKDKKYLIYCRSGSRTGMTLGVMKELGFKEVYDLGGGIIAWANAGEKFIK